MHEYVTDSNWSGKYSSLARVNSFGKRIDGRCQYSAWRKNIIQNRFNLGPNFIFVFFSLSSGICYPWGGDGYDYFLLVFRGSRFITKNSLCLDTLFMLSSLSETKYTAGGESQNTNCLSTCLYFLFLLSLLSTSIIFTEVYKSLYEFICQGLSLFLFDRNTLDLNTFDLKS